MSQNLFDIADVDPAAEEFRALLEAPGVTIERIVSQGHASPPGFWYEQPRAEWVLLLAGSAGLRFADEDDVRGLAPGDYLFIAALRKHRVEWTATASATIWLAVHFG